MGTPNNARSPGRWKRLAGASARLRRDFPQLAQQLFGKLPTLRVVDLERLLRGFDQ
jgi:hypothetical protein